MKKTNPPKSGEQRAALPEHVLFVCVRDRHGHGKSCAGSGSRALIHQMRAMLAAEDIGPAELDVQPAGCLGQCSRGPVCIAAGAESAKRRKPSKTARRKGRYLEVEEQDLRPMLREILRPAADATALEEPKPQSLS